MRREALEKLDAFGPTAFQTWTLISREGVGRCVVSSFFSSSKRVRSSEGSPVFVFRGWFSSLRCKARWARRSGIGRAEAPFAHSRSDISERARHNPITPRTLAINWGLTKQSVLLSFDSRPPRRAFLCRRGVCIRSVPFCTTTQCSTASACPACRSLLCRTRFFLR